jgi:hypothetical protein
MTGLTRARRELYGRRRGGAEVSIELGLAPFATSGGEFVLSSIMSIADREPSREQSLE